MMAKQKNTEAKTENTYKFQCHIIEPNVSGYIMIRAKFCRHYVKKKYKDLNCFHQKNDQKSELI